jgi:hypothetical protein
VPAPSRARSTPDALDADHLLVLAHLDAACPRRSDERGVELGAPDDRTEALPVDLDPIRWHLDAGAVDHDVRHREPDAELVAAVEAVRDEPAGTHLGTGVARLLEDQDALRERRIVAGEEERGRRTTRSAPDDDDLASLHARGR